MDENGEDKGGECRRYQLGSTGAFRDSGAGAGAGAGLGNF